MKCQHVLSNQHMVLHLMKQGLEGSVHAQVWTHLWDPMDCSPLGSSVRGISQARILQWVAISSSRGSSQPRDGNHVSCIGRQILYPLSHRKSLEERLHGTDGRNR